MAILPASGGGSGGSSSGSSDPREELRQAAGQQKNSTSGGSQLLASGGDPVSASMSISPGGGGPDIGGATRLFQSAVRSGDSKQVVRNVKNVWGQPNDPAPDPETTNRTSGGVDRTTNTGNGGPAIIDTATNTAVGSGVSNALNGLAGQIQALLGQKSNGGGGPGLLVLALGALAVFFFGREL